MPLTATEATLNGVDALLCPATDASIDAEVLEVGAALTGLALAARVTTPSAKYVVLSDSDQGSWAVYDHVEDADGEPLDDTDSIDENENRASHLYDNRRYIASPYVDEDEDHIDRRNPWEGVRIDIDKVLANPPAMQRTDRLFRLLDLSTAHLPQEQMQRIIEADTVVIEREYGALVWVAHSDPAEQDAALIESGFPDLVTVLRYAREIGEDVYWVQFDRDAEPNPNLPTWDW